MRSWSSWMHGLGILPGIIWNYMSKWVSIQNQKPQESFWKVASCAVMCFRSWRDSFHWSALLQALIAWVNATQMQRFTSLHRLKWFTIQTFPLSMSLSCSKWCLNEFLQNAYPPWAEVPRISHTILCWFPEAGPGFPDSHTANWMIVCLLLWPLMCIYIYIHIYLYCMICIFICFLILFT